MAALQISDDFNVFDYIHRSSCSEEVHSSSRLEEDHRFTCPEEDPMAISIPDTRQYTPEFTPDTCDDVLSQDESDGESMDGGCENSTWREPSQSTSDGNASDVISMSGLYFTQSFPDHAMQDHDWVGQGASGEIRSPFEHFTQQYPASVTSPLLQINSGPTQHTAYPGSVTSPSADSESMQSPVPHGNTWHLYQSAQHPHPHAAHEALALRSRPIGMQQGHIQHAYAPQDVPVVMQQQVPVSHAYAAQGVSVAMQQQVPVQHAPNMMQQQVHVQRAPDTMQQQVPVQHAPNMIQPQVPIQRAPDTMQQQVHTQHAPDIMQQGVNAQQLSLYPFQMAPAQTVHNQTINLLSQPATYAPSAYQPHASTNSGMLPINTQMYPQMVPYYNTQVAPMFPSLTPPGFRSVADQQGYAQLQSMDPVMGISDNMSAIPSSMSNSHTLRDGLIAQQPHAHTNAHSWAHSLQQQALANQHSFATTPFASTGGYSSGQGGQHPALARQQSILHQRYTKTSSRLAPKRNTLAELRPNPGASKPSQTPKQRRGGRLKGSKLNEDCKENAKITRDAGGCWRCRLRREKCGVGNPCPLCRVSDSPCVRLKLSDLVELFLPESVQAIHRNEYIERIVMNEVHAWNKENSFNITLTTGWGNPLQWPVSEIVPKTEESLIQYQYFEDPITRQMNRVPKYSPPLAIERFTTDDNRADEYLDSLYDEVQLQDFSEMCFAAESHHETFQEELLRLLCKLYLSSDDTDESKQSKKTDTTMKVLLKLVLRMLILTYIMGHTLTIVESEIQSVVARLPNMPRSGHKKISPRLANRQLKFYFAVKRKAIYTELLCHLQKILGASHKNRTWLFTFVIMIGFAVVLEEIQGSLHIQADSRHQSEGGSWHTAQEEARKDASMIDDKFDLLYGFLKQKYPFVVQPKGGSLGSQVPPVQHHTEREFLRELDALVKDRQDYLERRRDTELGHENQCYYTSRLVAKLLLPFMGAAR